MHRGSRIPAKATACWSGPSASRLISMPFSWSRPFTLTPPPFLPALSSLSSLTPDWQRQPDVNGRPQCLSLSVKEMQIQFVYRYYPLITSAPQWADLHGSPRNPTAALTVSYAAVQRSAVASSHAGEERGVPALTGPENGGSQRCFLARGYFRSSWILSGERLRNEQSNPIKLLKLNCTMVMEYLIELLTFRGFRQQPISSK